MLNVLLYRDKKIYQVVKMTPEERNRYYSPMINNFIGLSIWSCEHEKRYEELKEKRKNDAYLYTDKKTNGIIVFSVLDQNKKWDFLPAVQSLF